MNEHKWLEERFNGIDEKIKDLKHLMKNHLQHHFIFTIAALAAVVSMAVTLIKVFYR